MFRVTMCVYNLMMNLYWPYHVLCLVQQSLVFFFFLWGPDCLVIFKTPPQKKLQWFPLLFISLPLFYSPRSCLSLYFTLLSESVHWTRGSWIGIYSGQQIHDRDPNCPTQGTARIMRFALQLLNERRDAQKEKRWAPLLEFHLQVTGDVLVITPCCSYL